VTNIRSAWLLSLVLLLFLFTSCGPVVRSGASDGQVFVPPTPVSAANPATTPSATGGPPAEDAGDPGQPSPTAPCQDNLVFRSDITIPDGTRVQPDSTLDKRWEVTNNGSCNWKETYRVRLIAGPDLGAQPEQSLYPARSGSQAVLRIVFKAPDEAGTYRSAWQAFNPQGEPFGDPFFIEVVVE
jgi:hypothetical protein